MKSDTSGFGGFKTEFIFDYAHMCVCIHECRYPYMPEDDVRSPGAGGTAGHEPPNTGAGNHTLDCKSSKRISHISPAPQEGRT